MNDPLDARADAASVACAVRARLVSAAEVVGGALARVASRNTTLNAFTAVCADRAQHAARRIDASIASGEPAGQLAGVPFAVKAQIDVAGLTTTAGSKLHVDDPPATRDAVAVARLERAGAICIGVTNMDEFGMGGTTENRHFGVTRNPHDVTRTPGGSSGGSAAVVAAGIVPIALGSDALGSVRLPASLCGVYGLRPTRGVIAGEGLLPPPGTIATIGPFARTAADLAACFEAAAEESPWSEALAIGEVADVRIGIVGGYFEQNLSSEGARALALAAKAFPKAESIAFPEPARARAAAVLVNASESAGPHLQRLRTRADDFDPLTRDRFLAHALLPAAWYFRAQAFRRWHKTEVLRLLQVHPVLLFPATPCIAPPIGTRTLAIDGVEQPTGPSLGLYTQPLAALDCPVLSVPIATGSLPVGVQLLAAPGHERLLFAIAAYLERLGVVRTAIAEAAN